MSEVDQVKRAALEQLWANVEAALDQPDIHGKFVRFAVDSELYLPAIEHYKALAARGPEYAAIAEKWQKSIAAQAAAKVFARAPDPGQTPAAQKRRKRLLLFLFFVLSGLASWIVSAWS